MYKKDLGISLYPEHFGFEENKKYIDNCYNLGIKKAFLSLIHLNLKDGSGILNEYKKIFKYLKEKNFYTILDIVWETNLALGFGKNDYEKYKELGISCLRLDSPITSKEMADATFCKIDVQINASNDNIDYFKDVLNYKPVKQRIYACHNFYPLKNSGLSFEKFSNISKKIYDLNIHLSAFVGSHTGDRGPQKELVSPLVSCEEFRNISLKAQAKILLNCDFVSTIIIGNQMASLDELKDLVNVLNVDKFQFDLEIENNLNEEELKVINYSNHFWRGDINDYFIRSTDFRAKSNQKMPQNITKKILNFGDVCIINENNNHYKNELIIVIKDNFKDLKNTVNYIGKISTEDKLLLKQIKGWNKFEFKIR